VETEGVQKSCMKYVCENCPSWVVQLINWKHIQFLCRQQSHPAPKVYVIQQFNSKICAIIRMTTTAAVIQFFII
jgi:hypothetical protein